MIPIAGHKRVISGGWNRDGDCLSGGDHRKLQLAASDAELKSAGARAGGITVRANNFLVPGNCGGLDQGFNGERSLPAIADVQIGHCNPVSAEGSTAKISII